MRTADVMVFVVELAVYTAVGATGWRQSPALGIAGVIAMATWWGMLHAPKARVHLPRPVDHGLRLVWFGVGAGCVLLWAVRA